MCLINWQKSPKKHKGWFSFLSVCLSISVVNKVTAGISERCLLLAAKWTKRAQQVCAFHLFPKWDFSPESLTSQLFRWAWRAQGLLILAVSSQEVSHAKIKTDLRCRFHHLPLESLKCKPTERKGSPLASGLTAACSVKSEGCCNQETLILFNVITKCLSDYPGLLPGKTTERKCNKKKKRHYSLPSVLQMTSCLQGLRRISIICLSSVLKKDSEEMWRYWLARKQQGNGYINDKCLRASRDGRRTWQEDELRRWLSRQPVLVRRSGPPEPTQLHV